MEITPKQQRNLYAVFLGLFTVNVLIAFTNYQEQKRLRKLQKELAEMQLENQRKKKYEEENKA